MRVTLGQVRVGPDRAANLRATRSVIVAGARAGADLVVLPEYASCFDVRGIGIGQAEPLEGPYFTGLLTAARENKVAVIAGLCVPGPCGQRARNVVAAVCADGEVRGLYTKVHLYDAFGHRESDRLLAGDPDAEPATIQIAGLRVGIITCYDLRFPESARRLIDAGSQVLVVPSAWASGPHKVDHWRTLARARAIENTVAVVAVGQAGPGVIGHSLVVDADGQILAELSDAPEMRTVDISADALMAVQERNPSLHNRRYRVIPQPR